MKDTFMERAKEVSRIMKARQEKYGHDKMALPIPYALEIDDFINLVEMAERAEYLEKEFKQYYKAACQQEASKPYELYDPTEIQALQRVASWLRIDLEQK